MKTINCFVLIPLVLTILIHFSCKVKNTQTADANTGYHAPASSGKNSCFISGKILTIDHELNTQDTTSPCSKYPCSATVLITKTGNRNPGFTSTVSAGDTLEVNFIYTLEPTSNIKLMHQNNYPGLKEGNFFNAWLEQRMQPGNIYFYRIYGYEKTE